MENDIKKAAIHTAEPLQIARLTGRTSGGLKSCPKGLFPILRQVTMTTLFYKCVMCNAAFKIKLKILSMKVDQSSCCFLKSFSNLLLLSPSAGPSLIWGNDTKKF